MRNSAHRPSISTVRADALFASPLQRHEQPGAGEVRQAVAAAIRAFGERGCAAQVAQEFGDHPEAAVARMRWARRLAQEAFSGPQPGPARARAAAPDPAVVLAGYAA